MCTSKLKGGKHNLSCVKCVKKKRSFLIGDATSLVIGKGSHTLILEPVFLRWLKTWIIGIMGTDWTLKEVLNRPNTSQICFPLKPRVKTCESGLILRCQSNQNLTFTVQEYNAIPTVTADCLFNNMCSFH